MKNITKKIKLPKLISNSMILQRNSKVKIWGWAPSNKKVVIRLIDETYQTMSNSNGEWETFIKTGNAGGPYIMEVEMRKEPEELIVIKDIYFGDVWVCSGQSNMGMNMLSVCSTYINEINKANDNCIRQFLVPEGYNLDNIEDNFKSGSWVKATCKNIYKFSAIAYFFAKFIYEKYKIPIGIINASQGGSPIEAWMSKEALNKTNIKAKKNNKNIDKLLKKQDKKIEKWYQDIKEKDKFIINKILSCNLNITTWNIMQVPSYWEDFCGIIWFVKEVNITAPLVSDKECFTHVGNIIEENEIYINGTKIGENSIQYIPTKYKFNSEILKKGKNIIAIRVISTKRNGGFYKGKPYKLVIGKNTIDLNGKWRYKIGVKAIPKPERIIPEWLPSALFNSMIAPILNYKIRGVLWYQGESNIKNANKYEERLHLLIKDWRMKWQNSNLPFLHVQLPNYVEKGNNDSKNKWAILREAQRKILSIPNTAMAVTIDIGDWRDIHPQNKKEVGYRLALLAQKVAYKDKKVVAEGPLYKDLTRNKNKLEITFTGVGSGLTIKGDTRLKGFEVAGNNKKYVEAKAEIIEEKIIVYEDNISNPEYIRYAWKDNPQEANLYNAEGLPASPFSAKIY